jgi:hypothetical protein
VPGIPEQLHGLKQLVSQLRVEVNSQDAPYTPATAAAFPHLTACLDKLESLTTVLDTTPPSVVVPFHPLPQVWGVGHRHHLLVSRQIEPAGAALSGFVDVRICLNHSLCTHAVAPEIAALLSPTT